jgi:hypothetical protein
MAGYMVSARIERVSPRFVATTDANQPIEPRASSPVAVETIDLSGRSFGDRLSDWVAGLGEAWSQTVFFLFDPQSWR